MSIKSLESPKNYREIPNNHLTDHSNNPVDLKTKKVALDVLAILSIAAGATLIGLGVASIITPGLAFLSIPLFLGAAACFYYAKHPSNSIAPEELHLMKLNADSLTFTDTVKKFGLKETIEKKIQTPEQMKAKLLKEVSTSSFTEFKQKVSRSELPGLYRYRIIDESTLKSLDTLYDHSALCNSLQFQQKINLKAKYPLCKDSLLESTTYSSKPTSSLQIDPEDEAGYTAEMLKASKEHAEHVERFNQKFKTLFNVQ